MCQCLFCPSDSGVVCQSVFDVSAEAKKRKKKAGRVTQTPRDFSKRLRRGAQLLFFLRFHKWFRKQWPCSFHSGRVARQRKRYLADLDQVENSQLFCGTQSLTLILVLLAGQWRTMSKSSNVKALQVNAFNPCMQFSLCVCVCLPLLHTRYANFCLSVYDVYNLWCWIKTNETLVFIVTVLVCWIVSSWSSSVHLVSYKRQIEGISKCISGLFQILRDVSVSAALFWHKCIKGWIWIHIKSKSNLRHCCALQEEVEVMIGTN